MIDPGASGKRPEHHHSQCSWHLDQIASDCDCGPYGWYPTPSVPTVTLRELRLNTGITQTDLAETLGVSVSVIRRLENHRDRHIRAIQDYIAALGGVLSLRVRIGDQVYDLKLFE